MKNNSSKCWHYEPVRTGKDILSNCATCQHWIEYKQRCEDKQLLLDKYAESKAFRTYDHMMKDNRGISI